MRKAGLAAVIVIFAAVLLIVILPRFISIDSFKPRITSQLEEKTGRKVTFSDVRLSLFPGIGLKITGLAVSGEPGRPGENFLSMPEAEIRLAFFPLLAGRLEFAKVIMKRPEVIFRKYRDGTHSMTSIAERLSEKEGTPPAPSADKESTSVVLRSISIEKAKLNLFLEQESGPDAHWVIDPFTLSLDGIGGRSNEFRIEADIGGELKGKVQATGSLTRGKDASAGLAPYSIAAQGDVFGQPVKLEGGITVRKEGTDGDLVITFPKIEMDKIPGIFASTPDPLAKASPEGIAVLTARITGNLEKPGFAVKADLTRAGWTVAPGLRKFIDMPCTFQAQGSRLPDRISISAAELQFPPLRATGSGAYFPSTGRREWAASASIASLSDFSRTRGDLLSKWSPAGKLTASGKGVRPTDSAKEAWHVSLDLSNVAARFPEEKVELADLDGHLEINPQAVEFQPLAGLLNGQRFSLKGTVSLGSATTGQASLYMPYLDLDSMFPPGEGGGKKGADKPAESAGSGEKEISARGNVRIDAGKIKGFEFKELTGNGRYERGTLTIESLNARVYDGEASLSGRIRFTPPDHDFRIKVHAKNIKVEEALSRKTSLKDFITGKGSLSADIGGRSSDFKEFSRTAAGSGSFRVTGGKIKGVDIPAAAAGLAGLGGSTAREGLPGETSFSDLGGDFRIEGGKVLTESLKVASGKFNLEGKAALGFDRSFDFRGTLVLPKELPRPARGIGGKFLTDSSGRVEIPLTMSGTVSSPRIAIDTEALAKGAARKTIRRLLQKDTEPDSAPVKEGEKPREKPDPEKKLKDIFDRLLPGGR